MAISIKDIGLGFARTLLPKPLERKFGIAKEIQAFPVGEGLTKKEKELTRPIISGETAKLRGAKEVVKGEFFSDPDEFREDVKQTVRDLLKTGVTSKDSIKNSINAAVKQRINEQMILRVLPKELPTVSGFLKNVKRNTEEIVDGLGALVGIGFQKALHPIESTKKDVANIQKLFTSPQYRQDVKKTFIDPIINEYKEYRHPLQKAYEDPLDVFLDVTALLSLGGIAIERTGVKVATEAGKIRPLASEISQARKAQQVAQAPSQMLGATRLLREAQQIQKTIPTPSLVKVGRAIEQAGVSIRKVATPFSIKNISNATKSVLQAMPGGGEIVRNIELASETRKLLRSEQISFLNTRNKIINELNQTINKLSKDEVTALPHVAESFASPVQGASDNFYRALGMMRSLAKDQERFGLRLGVLSPEIIERRRFQPLANWLSKQDEFKKLLSPDANTTLLPIHSLTGAPLQGYIKTIKKFFPEADPIYMRHFFEDTPKKFSSFFLNTQPVRAFKPGFLKKSYGVEGYIGSSSKVTKQQVKDILSRQATENIKWQRNIELINTLKNSPFTKPLKAGEDLLPGHVAFAPDGFIRFYQGTIDLTSEWKKALAKTDNVWDAFEDTVESIFPKQKKFIGVTSNVRLWQVPEAVANQLNKIAKSTNPYWKLFYDKPLDAFRASVLSLLPRWHTNNIAGNIIFSVISGDIFNPKAFFIQHQAKQRGLLPDELFGGVHEIERSTSGRLGRAAELPLVKSTVELHDALLNTQMVGTLVKGIEKSVNFSVVRPLTKLVNLSFKVNKYVDDLFKGAAFVNRALREERKGFITRMTTNFDESLKILEKIKKSGEKTSRLIDDVHDWYYHGLNITDFERRIVRRVIPFYSWLRWISLYSLKITTEAPMRATILKNLSKDFYLFTGQNKLPDFLKGSVPIGNDEDGTVYYLTTRGVNPFSFVNEVLKEGIVEASLQGLAPLPKTMVERTTGRELFTGREFTRESIQKDLVSGKLYKFDPETERVVQVNETVKPALMEQLLRNYIPHYILLETLLTGGNIRYTAEGLDEILKDLYRSPSERKSIVKDIITQMPKESSNSVKQEILKALGINIKSISPENRISAKEALERATSAIKNKEIPLLNENFKKLLKEKVAQEIFSGTPREEIGDKIRIWIGRHVEQLKTLVVP